MAYPIGKYSDDTLALQRALVLAGFSVGKNGSDGKMGPDTIDAIVEARDAFGLTRGPRIDIPLLVALGVRGKPAKPTKPPSLSEKLSLAWEAINILKGKPMNSTWFTSFVGTTAFKYLVAMLATYIAGKLGLDPVEGKATIEGVVTQLIGVAAGLWGMWESSRSKIVIDGKKVSVSELSTAEKNTVSNIVEAKK
jgi:hypothetical protein